MTIHDITLPLATGIPTWPGEPGPSYRPVGSIAAGDEANTTLVTFGSHTGTHLDAPAHFLAGGRTVDHLPLSVLVGPAVVIDVGDVDQVGVATLERADLPVGTERLVLKTRNSARWHEPTHPFRRDFVALTADAAAWAVARGIRLVGIDYLSIEQFDAPGHPVHHRLLEAGVVIVEGLDLRQVQPGRYTLVCLPLKLPGLDGSPVRAVLIE